MLAAGECVSGNIPRSDIDDQAACSEREASPDILPRAQNGTAGLFNWLQRRILPHSLPSGTVADASDYALCFRI
jgi:hypothetical protein